MKMHLRVLSAALLLLANPAFVSCKEKESDTIRTAEATDTVSTSPKDTIVTAVHMDDSIDDGI